MPEKDTNDTVIAKAFSRGEGGAAPEIKQIIYIKLRDRAFLDNGKHLRCRDGRGQAKRFLTRLVCHRTGSLALFRQRLGALPPSPRGKAFWC